MSPEAASASVFATPYGVPRIFCLRMVDVSCDAMRVLFAIRGTRGIAGLLGSLQARVWSRIQGSR